MLRFAEEAGATHARLTTTAGLEARDDVRASCEQNSCGKYGRCWTCPPTLGVLAELGERLRSYPEGLLIQNISTLEDSWDFEGMMAAAQTHNQMMRDLARRIAAHYPGCEVLPLGCGGCGYCEKCSCPDAPCRFPDEALASVEGYGLDVKALVTPCGLNYINGVNTVSYVGMVLFRMA